MATQGERRQQAVRAVRSLRRIFRSIDSAGEKVERELDRLIKRKTLISPDSLGTLTRLTQEFVRGQESLVKGLNDTAIILQFIPR